MPLITSDYHNPALQLATGCEKVPFVNEDDNLFHSWIRYVGVYIVEKGNMAALWQVIY